MTGEVYILHLDSPLAHARHYVGWARRLEQRIEHHHQGTGARLLQVCNERGISYRLATHFPGTRRDERRLKNQKNTARYCPVCNDNPYPLKGVQ